MLAGLFVLHCLISKSLLLAACELAAPVVLPNDVLSVVLSEVGFTTLYQSTYVSREFCALAGQAIKSLYGVLHDGKLCLNYTKILHELDWLVQDTGRAISVAEANIALQASPHFGCIRSILEARFGYCLRYRGDRLLVFSVQQAFLSALGDPPGILALPYVLDQTVGDPCWNGHLRRLADVGRFDLLSHMTFGEITSGCFYELMGVAVPTFVAAAAAECLQRNEPASKLSNLLAFAGFGLCSMPMPEDCKVPLFILRYMHENGIKVPEGCIFIDGLGESSIAFWKYLMEISAAEAETLLRFVLAHGNDESLYLASTFYKTVPQVNLGGVNTDVYQAMLIRFRFSPMCNEHIVQNYESMLGEPPSIDYHTACALLDCKQWQPLHQDGLEGLRMQEGEVLLDKMVRLKDVNLDALISKYSCYFRTVPGLLKRLIQKKADGSRIQLLWDSMESRRGSILLDFQCCSAPLNLLKRFACEPNISVSDVQSMIDMLEGLSWIGSSVSRKVHALYLAMFWEAPESVVRHFFDRAPHDVRLKCDFVGKFLAQSKYSSGLCKKILKSLEPVDPGWLEQTKEYRPDLAKELDCCKEGASW